MTTKKDKTTPTDLSGYRSFLEEKGFAASTLKAYLKDALAFEGWETSFMKRRRAKRRWLSGELVEAYLTAIKAKPAYRNRLLSSLTHLFAYRQQDQTADTQNRLLTSVQDLGRSSLPVQVAPEPIPLFSLHHLFMVMQQESRNHERARNGALLLFLYGTGLPVAQACALKLEDVQLEQGEAVACEFQKGKTKHLLPLSPSAKKALRLWLQHRQASKKVPNSPYLFMALSTNRNRVAGEPLDPQGVRALLKRYGKLAKLSHPVTPSGLRRTFVYELERAGVDKCVVEVLLTHKRRGEDPDLTKLQEAVALLPDPMAPAPR